MRNYSLATTLFIASLTLAGCSGGGGGGSKNDTPPDGNPSQNPHNPNNPNNPGGDPQTTAADAFFLPTAGEARNTIQPRIESDAAGNLHLVYPAYAIGDAFYAYCQGDCRAMDQVSSIKFPTQGTVHNAMLALGPDHKPQLLLSTMSRIYYATCAGDCTQEAS